MIFNETFIKFYNIPEVGLTLGSVEVNCGRRINVFVRASSPIGIIPSSSDACSPRDETLDWSSSCCGGGVGRIEFGVKR